MTLNTKAFSSTPKTLTLGALAEKSGATLVGDPTVLIHGVGTLMQAKAGQITFLAERKYVKYLAQTQASAVIVSQADSQGLSLPALVTPVPKLVFTQIVAMLYPLRSVAASIHPSAVIAPSAQVAPNTFIGPNCVIGEGVMLGEQVVLQANCVIGDQCTIGAGTHIYPNVSIYHDTQIGQNCVIHSGVVIGSDGFGFTPHQKKWLKLGQIGRVVIGNNVEIGANTTIDRGAIDDTQIGDNVILDNLIQIAHNVKIGEGTAIAACCGISGSATIGKHCMIGGGSGVVGHIEIADHVTILGSSNVGQSITQAGAYGSGLTTVEMKTWKRNLVRFHQLDNLAGRLIELERRFKEE